MVIIERIGFTCRCFSSQSKKKLDNEDQLTVSQRRNDRNCPCRRAEAAKRIYQTIDYRSLIHSSQTTIVINKQDHDQHDQEEAAILRIRIVTMLQLVRSKDRSSYQELPIDDDDVLSGTRRNKNKLRYWYYPYNTNNSPRFLTRCVSTIAFLSVLWSASQSWSAVRLHFTPATAPIAHHEALPTLLNVRDPDTDTYVYALDNILYDRIPSPLEWNQLMHQQQELNQNARQLPQLIVDKHLLDFHQPLRLSWTNGQDSFGRHIVTEDTLIVFTCSADDEDDFNKEGTKNDVLDVATVKQARSTSWYHLQQQRGATAYHTNKNNNLNEWIIPRFPILRTYRYCQFGLVNVEKDDTLSVLAKTDPIIIHSRSIHLPSAIHLALMTDPSRMMIRFTTGTIDNTNSNNNKPIPMVHYGTSLAQLTELRQGSTETYTAEDMCMAPANETEPGKFLAPGWLHSVVMDQLQPNTKYYYKVGTKGGQGVIWSEETYSFLSAPAASGNPNNNNTPFVFLTYGDQGCPSTGWTKGGEWIARMVELELNHKSNNSSDASRLPIRMVHHIGDLSYAQGAAHIWDEWQQMMQPITTRVPYMIGVGNHEYDHMEGGGGNKDPSGETTPGGFHPDWGNFGNDSGGECGVPTAKRFTMPRTNSSNGVFWYSYDFANLHTIMISAEHDLHPGTRQYEWLENDLRSVNRTRTPWVILESHRPLYNAEAEWEQNAVGIGMRLEFEDLLRDYNVDMVVAGHYHAYHRTCDGLYRDVCNNGGPTQLTIGSAGARLDETWLYPNSWTAKFIQQEYGYGRITIMNATALHFEFVKVGDSDDATSGEVHDDFWIHRDR